jgi:hypothetical protein
LLHTFSDTESESTASVYLDIYSRILNNESMEISREYKDAVAKHLVETVLTAIQKESLSTEQMPLIAEYYLGRIDSVSTHNELVLLLKGLAQKWPVLQPLVTIEEGKMKERLDKQAIVNVEQLVQRGQIDEALTVAKAATQG